MGVRGFARLRPGACNRRVAVEPTQVEDVQAAVNGIGLRHSAGAKEGFARHKCKSALDFHSTLIYNGFRGRYT